MYIVALAFVELAQQHEEFVGGGMETPSQCRNRLAEVIGVRSASEHEGVWRGVVVEGFHERCGEHVPS